METEKISVCISVKILYPATLLNSLMCSCSFLLASSGFSMYNSIENVYYIIYKLQIVTVLTFLYNLESFFFFFFFFSVCFSHEWTFKTIFFSSLIAMPRNGLPKLYVE